MTESAAALSNLAPMLEPAGARAHDDGQPSFEDALRDALSSDSALALRLPGVAEAARQGRNGGQESHPETEDDAAPRTGTARAARRSDAPQRLRGDEPGITEPLTPDAAAAVLLVTPVAPSALASAPARVDPAQDSSPAPRAEIGADQPPSPGGLSAGGEAPGPSAAPGLGAGALARDAAGAGTTQTAVGAPVGEPPATPAAQPPLQSGSAPDRASEQRNGASASVTLRTDTGQSMSGSASQSGSAAQSAPRATPVRASSVDALRPLTNSLSGPGAGRAAPARSGVRAMSPASDPGLVRDPDTAVSAQVARGLAAALRQRSGTITLRLFPESLGQLRIDVTVDGRSVSARLEASDTESRDLLARDEPALRAALESRGLKVDDIQVVVRDAAAVSTPADAAHGTTHAFDSSTDSSGTHGNDGRRPHSDRSGPAPMPGPVSDAPTDTSGAAPIIPGGYGLSWEGDTLRLDAIA